MYPFQHFTKLRVLGVSGVLVASILALSVSGQAENWHLRAHHAAIATRPSIASIIKAGQGRQLVMIVFGSSRCGASRGSQLARSLSDIRDSLRVVAGRRKTPFVSIGVALDADPNAGLDWLGEIGGFDEISAGQSWLNTAANEYLWRQPHGVAVTPQVVVVLRRIQGIVNYRFNVSEGDVLVRMVGSTDIRAKTGVHEVDSLLGASGAQQARQPRS